MGEPGLIYEERLPFRQNHRALDYILQLADVARPIVCMEELDRPLVYVSNLLAQFFGVAVDQVSDQQGNIANALAQCRQSNRKNVSAAGIPVAYLTARVALTLAGFGPGKTVLAPAIGGSLGNAVTQLARALGAKHAISSTTNHAKAEQAKVLGFDEVIDTSFEKLGDGMRRITDGYGADIVIDGIGGEILSEALKALALGGSLTTLGYSGNRKTTIDVTDLIVPQASIRSLNMFRQPQATVTDAWNAIVSLLQSGAIKPIVAKTFPLAEAAEALRYLVEGRPFGRVVLTV